MKSLTEAYIRLLDYGGSSLQVLGPGDLGVCVGHRGDTGSLLVNILMAMSWTSGISNTGLFLGKAPKSKNPTAAG